MGADGSKESPVAVADGESGGSVEQGHVEWQTQQSDVQWKQDSVSPALAEPRSPVAATEAASVLCDELGSTQQPQVTSISTGRSAAGRLSEMDEIENLIVVLEHGSDSGIERQSATTCRQPRPLQPSQRESGAERPPLPPLLSRLPPPRTFGSVPNGDDSGDYGTTPSLRHSGKDTVSVKQSSATTDAFDPLKFKDANKSPRMQDANSSSEIPRKSTPDIAKVKSVALKLEPQYNDDEVELLVSIERDLIQS